MKDAVWPLAAGVVAAGSCLRGKPVTFFMLRPMLTQGRAENRPFWDQVWSCGRAFRRCLRVLAIGWSVILLTAGAAELLLAAFLPLSAAAAGPAARAADRRSPPAGRHRPVRQADRAGRPAVPGGDGPAAAGGAR